MTTDTYRPKYSNPRLDYMERGTNVPMSSPFVMKNEYPTLTNERSMEEGKGFYSLNRSSSPYYSPSATIPEPSSNPTFWQKIKGAVGLGGKRKTKKNKKTRKTNKKTKKTRKSNKKIKRKYGSRKKRGGGVNIVNPYEPPMDFAPIQGIPTAQPHHYVG